MKFGIRTPSLRKSLAARLSVSRYIRHRLGVKVPRGFGLLANPKKAVYNKIYRKTSISFLDIVKMFFRY